MTVGMITLCAGAALLGAALLATIVTAVTGPAEKKKMEQRMREKY
jgi:hypothetical protein